MHTAPQQANLAAPTAGEEFSRSPTSALAQILGYHERSKHRLERYAASPETLDWDSQPNPFREYAGAPRIRLPLVAETLGASFAALHLPGSIAPQPLKLDSVAALLELSFGLSAWKEYGPDRWAVRCNPSSGNLHPTEAYVVCRHIPGLDDGVYHYLSRDHSLEQRCRYAAAPIAAPPRLLVGLSSISWREAWKYGERAFRYCQLDTGHALGALRYAAATLGWGMRIEQRCGSRELSQLLGLDRDGDYGQAEREEPELLLEITLDQLLSAPSGQPPFAADIAQQNGWHGQANTLDPHHMYRWPVIDEVEQASRKPPTAPTAPTAEQPTGGWPPLKQEGAMQRGDVKAATLIRQRRSAQRFDAKFTQDAASFWRLLDALLPRPSLPWDAWQGPPKVHPVLFVHRVEGLAPGLYALPRSAAAQAQMQASMRADFSWSKAPGCPAHLPLFLVAEASLGKAAKSLCCHQAIAGDSSFMLAMLAEFDAPLADAPWHYRQLYREAGLMGHVLYLQAEAAGLRGTGVGCFFDDVCHELLGLQDKTFQSLYQFTVGYPLTDQRIANLPPYS